MDNAGQPDHAATATRLRGSGRARVLDAYADILATDGVQAATLDEVAHRADISKGGLLHHFGSKEDLIAGLIDRLIAEHHADREATKNAGPDVVHAYLRASMVAKDDNRATLIAAMRLAGTGNEAVDAAIAYTEKSWFDLLNDDIDDPVLSRLIQLVGDGLYLNAMVGANSDDYDDDAVAEYVRRLVSD